MADISQIVIPDNTTYNLKDSVARNYLVYYIAGPSTNTAGTWTGTCADITSYYDGLTIIYTPGVAGGSSTTTLNINSLGAKTCYYINTTKLTTQYAAGVPILFTYVGGYWKRADYNTNTTSISNLVQGNGNFVADSAVYRYQLLVHTDRDTLSPFNNVNESTDTDKTILTSIQFDPFDTIYYYNAATNIAAGAYIAGSNCHYSVANMNLRYSFNVPTDTFTAHKDIYMKVTFNPATGLCKMVGEMPLTQTLPTTADGYMYLFLGRAASGYQMTLYPYHPLVYHNGSALCVYMKDVTPLIRPGTGSGAVILGAYNNGVTASGTVAHAEGGNTTASGNYSHAEGTFTIASGHYSHAEGRSTIAIGPSSHAEGLNTTANSKSQHVFGEYNVLDTESTNSRATYVEIVGNGTGGSARSNARTLSWTGNEWLAGAISATGITIRDSTGDVTLSAAQLRSLLALIS